MYSAQVLDHFEHPRNAGTIADADASARIENPACGDILELTLKIDGGPDRGDSFPRQGMRGRDGLRFGADGACPREEH